MLSKKNLKNYSPELDKRTIKMLKQVESRSIIVACEGDDNLLIVKLVNSERQVSEYDTIFYCTKDDYIRRDFDGKYRKGALESLYYIGDTVIRSFSTPFVFSSIKDKKLMKKVLNKWQPTTLKTTAINHFLSYQNEIKSERYKKKISVEIAAIDSKMMKVKEPSKAFYNFAYKEAFRETYLFYSGDKAHCSYCEKEVTLTKKPKHNKESKCPVCKRKALFKNIKLGRGNINDRATAVKVENTDNGGILIRHFCLWRTFKDYQYPKISCYEQVREYVYKNNSQTYEMGYFHGSGIYRWCRADSNAESHLHVARLYKRGLRAVLNKSDFKYCQLMEINNILEENSAKKKSGWIYTWFFETYRKSPIIESLYKVGFKKIVSEMLMYTYETGSFRNSIIGETSILKALGVSKEQYNILYPIREVVSVKFVEFIRNMNAYKLPVYDIETYKKLFDVLRSSLVGGDLVELLQLMTPNKLIKYLRQTDKNNQNRSVPIYYDYINFAKKLNWDLKNSFVLYPKNLREAHDTAMKLVREEKKKSEIAKVNELLPKIHEIYDYQSNKLNLCVTAPNNGADIIAEGQALHHCVGGYLDRIGFEPNDSIILFVRHINEIDKPYYTMEIKKGEINQLYGMKNCGANEEVKALRKEYEEKVLGKLLAMAG